MSPAGIQDQNKKHPTIENRLKDATSPYLLQHAYQPVEWQPWDDLSLHLAKLNDKPIFLSIGYSACHWCHVMAHESFENKYIAAIMNRHFINIKVDREERPDLDDIYMNAIVALTGRGGWPASIFLTPDLKPFYGGTYFPPESHYGIPGFVQVLEEIVRLWENERSRIMSQASGLTQALSTHLSGNDVASVCDPQALIDKALKSLDTTYDPKWGGWGGAPKFPSSLSISLLLRNWSRKGTPHHLKMIESTLTNMAAGGIYDHLGGGFHRYSVDEQWKVPHFEKMLYDNAQLAVSYLEAGQATGRKKYHQIATGILEYVLRELTHTSGGFFASEDADSEGMEGKYYLWSMQEIKDTLNLKDAAQFFETYSFSANGNFDSHDTRHDGLNLCYRLDLAEQDHPNLKHIKSVLFQHRCKRSRPGLDDKIIAAWNGMMISAFAKASFILNNPRYLQAALRAGDFMVQHLVSEGNVLRVWRDGKSQYPGYLEDYASLSNAFLDLYECTFDTSWLLRAKSISDRMISLFHDQEKGAFYSTGPQHKHLIIRMKTFHDTAEPSGNATAATALIRLAWYFKSTKYESIARECLSTGNLQLEKSAQGCLGMIHVADLLLHGLTQIVIVLGDNDENNNQTLEILRNTYVPNRILACIKPGQDVADIPAVQDKIGTSGDTISFLCVNKTCFPPFTSPEDLDRAIKSAFRYSSSCTG